MNHDAVGMNELMADYDFPPLAIQADILLGHYGFDLEGQSSHSFIQAWLAAYPVNWLRTAVIEALYQGRYKAKSVSQILQLWARREQPLRHFNHEFESIICRELPYPEFASCRAEFAAATPDAPITWQQEAQASGLSTRPTKSKSAKSVHSRLAAPASTESEQLPSSIGAKSTTAPETPPAVTSASSTLPSNVSSLPADRTEIDAATEPLLIVADSANCSDSPELAEPLSSNQTEATAIAATQATSPDVPASVTPDEPTAVPPDPVITDPVTATQARVEPEPTAENRVNSADGSDEAPQDEAPQMVAATPTTNVPLPTSTPSPTTDTAETQSSPTTSPAVADNSRTEPIPTFAPDTDPTVDHTLWLFKRSTSPETPAKEEASARASIASTPMMTSAYAKLKAVAHQPQSRSPLS